MLTDWLQPTRPERVVFKRPPLVLAVFQVQFSDIPEITEWDFIEPFKSVIKDWFPVFNPVKQIGVQFDLGMSEPRRIETVHWQFKDESGDWTVVLTRDFLTLETRSYEHFADFLSRLRFLLNNLVEYLHPKIGTRLGLRYVNEIRVGDQNLSSIINPQLLGLLSDSEVEKRTVQSHQEIVLRFPDEQFVHVKHGLFPTGNAVQPRLGQQPSTGPFYLLDFDAFRTFSAPTWLRMEPETIYELVVKYHDDIENLFLWSLTEEYIQGLGGRDSAD